MELHGYRKPKMKASADKARLTNPLPRACPQDPFRGNLLTVDPPTLEQLRKIVKAHKYPKQASKAIKYTYGNFPFTAFGYGPFQGFCRSIPAC